MSGNGQGDEIDERKDDEAQLTSTTPDNVGVMSSVSNLDTKAVPIVSTTETIEFSNVDPPAIATTESADGRITSGTLDSNIAPTVKSMENDDSNPMAVMEAEIDSGDKTTVNVPEVGDNEDNIAPEESIPDIEPKLNLLKDINELINNTDKDSSSLGEELELRWEEDDDDDEINDTIPTDDVLKQLDQELEKMEVSDRNQKDDNEAEAEQLIKPESQIEIGNKNLTESTITVESVQDSSKIEDNVEYINQDVQLQSVDDVPDGIEHNIDEISINIDDKVHDVEMAGSFFEESQNIGAKDTSITQTMETSCTEIVEKPQIIGVVNSLAEEQDIDMEKVLLETEKPNEKKTELDDMDVDVSEEKSDDLLIVKSTLASIESPEHRNPTDILDNEDKGQIISDIKPKDMEKNEDVIEKADGVGSISQSDVPSISHSNIKDNVEVKNKDCQIETSSELTDKVLEISKKLTQEMGNNDVQTDVSQLEDDTIFETTNTRTVHHRINKPNVMLDIPTQELSDIEAELDDDELDYDNEDNVEKTESKPEIDDSDVDMKESNNTESKTEADETNPEVSPIIDHPSIEIDATTSKLNIITLSPAKLDQFDGLKPTSKPDELIDVDKQRIDEEMSTSNLVEDKPSTSKVTREIDDAKPSTSKAGTSSEKLTPDNTDDDQEVTDSLGLLAESSRIMDDDNDDDDDEAEDQEVDDHDDDEDFDPYEESNSDLALDMDDSNTPPPELDPKRGEPEPTPPLVPVGMESYEGTMDINDDIECVENELPEMDLQDGAASETPSNEGCIEKKDEPEIIDADAHKQTASKCPPEKIINILEKVLGQQVLTGAKPKDLSCNVKNYVELEGSSDSDGDVQEVSKSDAPIMISVNIPNDVEVMSTSGTCGTSDIVSKEGEVVISGVPKKPSQKMSKINTSEVSIKTTGLSSPNIHIPETISEKPNTTRDEIFNLDSDEEDMEKKESPEKEEKVPKQPAKRKHRICINVECQSDTEVYYHVDRVTSTFYSHTKRGGVVCEQCRQLASEGNEALISGVKDLRPLLDLDMTTPSQQLVEISDSDEDEERGDETPLIGEKGATFLEDNLVDMINETWTKYKMESRLRDTEACLMKELEKMEEGAKEIDAMLNECQKKTDEIRGDFYKDYRFRRKILGSIVIYDTPFSSFCCREQKQSKYIAHFQKDQEEVPQTTGSRYPKRRAASVAEIPAKRPAIPMGYTPLEQKTLGDKIVHVQDKLKRKALETPIEPSREDDKEDISVVTLSAESAPADLPPYGEIKYPPLKTGMVVYAMRNAFGTWLKGRIMEVQPKTALSIFTHCRVKFEHKIKNPCKVLAARCLAYPEPADVRMVIGTRVVALFKDPHNTARLDYFYSGVIAEIPNPVNSYRYLVFFDDGYAQYVRHQDTRIVCESNKVVWEEVHPFIREFIKNYLTKYPERPMVRLHAGEKLKTEWNGKWWDSLVLRVDASIALINFDEDDRTEWIYRGSTRLAPLYLELQAAEKAGEGKTRSRLPRSKAKMRSNMPCVEYTRSDEQASTKPTVETQALQHHNDEMRRQRAVAKKSTTTATAQPPTVVSSFEGVISRVVFYTPKNAVKPYKMSTHTCSVICRRSDLLSLKDLRTYNPLAKPLLSGWERQTVRYRGHKVVVYRAPCGRRLRNLQELHTYLRIVQSDLSVDLFDFVVGTHCLSEFVLHKCNVSKKDLSHGKENVPVPCVNYYDDSLPEFCSYNTERTPTAGVPLNLDPEFLCGCDCTDDCMDKTKCACWKMTLEGAQTIGLDGPNVGYVYRRLPEPLPSGIYECNSRCKCKHTCLNRVAQHPLQLKLQVFKTINRGWGIRALNDVPKGSFLCVYAGNLLTDATANLDGLNEGDEYLAELDYIEVVEAMKEGYEEDVRDADKKLDKKKNSSESESEPSSESEDERDKTEKDGDFQPGYIPHTDIEFKKSLRERREKAKKMEQVEVKEETKIKDDCITISDDEEVREPSRFTAQAGMVDRDLVSKQSSRVSVRTLYGKDEACYIMDAKVQGNIGRYLNHSCQPNVFVQNVFVDTHDPRFPWVAFFALSLVKAGTELTWNYNYDIGSVPEKMLYCYCGAPNCRGRLL